MDIAEDSADSSEAGSPREIAIQLISDDRFAPFGRAIFVPDTTIRIDSSNALASLRPHAVASLYTTLIPATQTPIDVKLMERHRYSSQTFLPLAIEDYLIIVAHSKPDGSPDISTVQAFKVPGDWGITYAPGVWHHPMITLGRDGGFAVLMWRDGGPDDEEYFPLDRHFTVREK